MFRIDTASAVGALPTPASAGTPGYFQNAVPGVSGATQLDQDFFNSLQEELYSLLSVGGAYGVGAETPSKDTYDQIKTQIEKFVTTYAGTASANTEDVVQAGHGFAKFDAIRHNGTSFVKSQADAPSNSDVVGIVSDVADTDNFTITYGGIVEWDAPPTPDYTLGSDLWLDPAVAGNILSTEPIYTQGQVRQYLGESVPSGLLVNVDLGEMIDNVDPIPEPSNTKGRLIKTLRTSGTLTINDNADDSGEAYLTSTEIKSGKYLAIVKSGGGGGGGYRANIGSHWSGGGAGEGGTSLGVIDISASTPFIVGSGGNGVTGTSTGATGGASSILTIASSGGVGGNGSVGNPGGGGAGDYSAGATGQPGLQLDDSTYGSRGNTTTPNGNSGSGAGQGGRGGYYSGGSGVSGQDGGDGLIEIYEWEA